MVCAVPADTLVLATYKSLDYASLIQGPIETRSGIFIHVKVKFFELPMVCFLFVRLSHSRLRCSYCLQNPQGQLQSTHETVEEGRFAFTTLVDGEYSICLQTNTTSWYGTVRKFRFHMDFEVGEHAKDYNTIAKQEHLSAIEVEIRKLNDKIRGIRAEQDYQKKREEVFRDISESTNARVMWWSLAQTAVLLISGLWQMSRLKVFFKQKKLA